MSAVQQQQHNTAAQTIFGVIDGTHQFQGGEFHTIQVGEDMWFRANDIARILGYVNPRDMLAKLVDREDQAQLKDLIESSLTATTSEFTYNELKTKYVTEPGIYSLVFKSKLPVARDFERYVRRELLPAVRNQLMQRLQIESREKDELIATLQRRELALSSYVHNTPDIPKTQVLYIATTRAYATQNRFKFGGVRELHDLRKRLLEYNVGRAEGDLYYYAQMYRCNSYRSAEERLHILLAHFKDKEDSRKEMVRMNFTRLCQVVEYVVSNFGGEVDYMNERSEVILRETVYENPVDVPPLDLNMYDGVAAATVRVDVSRWSDEEFSSMFEELIDVYAGEQEVDYTCAQDGPMQLELPWSAISTQVKKMTRGLTVMQWRDKFKQWYNQRRSARLHVRGLKLG